MRHCKISLRSILLLVTVGTVVCVGIWRYREWGKELNERRFRIEAEAFRRGEYSRTLDGEKLLIQLQSKDLEDFDREYWLPMMFYDLTCYDEP